MATDAGHSPAPDPRAQLNRLLDDDPADLYENAPCGYLSALPDGTVVKVNRTFCSWIGRPADEVLGSRFQDLLAIGGRVFHETHMVPLLRMQGAVRELALDVVRADGSVLPCLLNAVEVRDENGAPVLVRATLFEATARRRYEQELLTAQRVAQESEARARTLHRVVSSLAAATTVDDVAEVIVAHSRTALRAAGAALVLIGAVPPAREDLPVLTVARSDGIPAPLVDELRVAAGDQLSLELAQGVRSLGLDERLRAQRPGIAEAIEATGFAVLLVVPVTAESRRLGGAVVALTFPDGGLIVLEDPD